MVSLGTIRVNPLEGTLHANTTTATTTATTAEHSLLLPATPTKQRYGAVDPADPDSFSWPTSAYFILVVEACERVAYYGATIVFFTYMQTMLEFDQSLANALYHGFNFWAYSSCLLGGFVADTYLGRVNSVVIFSIVYMVGMISLVLSALPYTWSNFPEEPERGFAIPGFAVAMVFIGLGMGGIKSNVSTLMADQIEGVSDEAYASVFRWFYWAINLGSFVGIIVCPIMYDRIGEKKRSDPSDPLSDLSGTGYWAAFSLPLGLFAISFVVFLIGRVMNIYVAHPAKGSVLTECYRAARYAYRERRLAHNAETRGDKAHWLDWAEGSCYESDARDLKVALDASYVFLWYPVYWLCYGQMGSNLVAQAELLERPDWLAAEALNVLGSAALILLIPLFDQVIFPMLARCGMSPSPITRISIGFFLAAVSILYTAVLEYYIHEWGSFSDGDYYPDGEKISVWWQVVPYVVFGVSEIFASVGGLEFAYTESPESMKSVIMSLFLFTDATGSLLGMLVSPVVKPENMVFVFFACGGTMFVISVAFFLTFRRRKSNNVRNTRGSGYFNPP